MHSATARPAADLHAGMLCLFGVLNPALVSHVAGLLPQPLRRLCRSLLPRPNAAALSPLFLPACRLSDYRLRCSGRPASLNHQPKECCQHLPPNSNPSRMYTSGAPTLSVWQPSALSVSSRALLPNTIWLCGEYRVGAAPRLLNSRAAVPRS